MLRGPDEVRQDVHGVLNLHKVGPMIFGQFDVGFLLFRPDRVGNEPQPCPAREGRRTELSQLREWDRG